ncbi:auxin efflux carrier component 5-like [Humulus lupulus]|uniref:auxin efflux carrier component 5-like n=1 Tax=Humulus lupulus TaxID=3486 RepID=UPI002B403161|nr:auxin efflux carrier component 5-like [Humulus lupulus]
MIEWEDVYKVVEAMAPLYVALILGYGSVKWWKIFSPEQGGAINRFACFFTLPLYTFDFTAHVDPFQWNYRFIGADAISKTIIVVVLAFWAKLSSKDDSHAVAWSITSYSLSTLTNSLVVGVPLMKAMYGQIGVDIVVQSSVVQSIIWMTLLLIVLECYRSTSEMDASSNDVKNSVVCDLNNNKDLEKDVEEDSGARQSYWSLMKVVGLKLVVNPNSYAVYIGLFWAIIASRCDITMPGILEGSISIMAKAGAGTAMFSMGIFMALQKKIIACGVKLTVFGMVLRFIAGPAAMAIGCIAAGLHGDVLRVAIVQSALPQAIASFIFAKEYGLHAEVISTAVIFGTMVSVPVLIAFYIGLDLIHWRFV